MHIFKKTPRCMFMHCMIHRNALATNILPTIFAERLEKMPNKIKGSVLSSRLFKKLCEEKEKIYTQLLYYTPIRWLSKGKNG